MRRLVFIDDETELSAFRSILGNHYEYVTIHWPRKSAKLFSMVVIAEIGEACIAHGAHGTLNWERRFYPDDLPPAWENRWFLFDEFRERGESASAISVPA
jgi:hypothetical protein